jgi:uronate dehydrogenase
MTEERILITGGAGQVASLLRPRMVRPHRTLRLLDLREPDSLAGTGDEELLIGSVTDLDVMTRACRDVTAMIHLGGQSRENTIDNVLDLNVKGNYVALEAARRAGVSRVVLASSNHAVGFQPRSAGDEDGLPADIPARPDTLYGLSKVALESLGRMYVDRYGMDVICLRIGSWFPTPPGVRGLATWLSPDDGGRLIEACISTPSPGFRLVWGVSRNTRRWWSLAAGEAIGYHPIDDAEDFAADLLAAEGERDFINDADLNRVGGPWCEVELGNPMTG